MILVEGSGVARAALLLAEDEANRRRIRRAASRSQTTNNPNIKQSTLRIRTTDPTGVQTGKALTLVNPTSDAADITNIYFPDPFTYDATAGTCDGTYVPADSSCTIMVYLQPTWGTSGSWAETATIQFVSSPIYIDTVQLIGTTNYRP